MNCSCIDVGSDWDSGYILKDQMVRASKPHKCCECGRMIVAKEVYELVVGKWDGELSTYKTCRECSTIRAKFFCSWVYSQLWVDLREYANQGEGLSQTKIAELPVSAREKVCDFIESTREPVK